MPINNPYDFGGQSITQGTRQGGAYNPYGGYLQGLQTQRQDRDQATYAETMGKLRAAIAAIAARGQPQIGGALSAPQEVSVTPDKLVSGMTSQEMPDPEGYLYALGNKVESNNDYKIVNPASGAGGKYQFIQKTWNDLGNQEPSLALTPEGRTSDTPEGRAQQERAVRALTKQNAGILKTALGRMPTQVETYLAHLLGPGWATSVLRAPDTPVDALVPSSFVEANPFLRGISGKQLVQMFARKFNP